MTTTTQQIFDPIDFGFEWIADWYKFDAKAAEKKALAARNAEVKRLRKEGREVFPFTLSKQLRTMGGIGSGRPEIHVIVSAYGLAAKLSTGKADLFSKYARSRRS